MADYEGRYLHQQFGNYRLIKLLGYGGFAEVYLGEHVHLGTLAALKVLTANLTPDEIARFRDEARIIFGLNHPNIVRVLDYGLNGNIPSIVMNFAANGSLRTRHPRGTRVPLPTVVEYVEQIAAALQYAHDKNLVHRDIKPDNMLSDFGLVTVSSSVMPEQSQARTGTWTYMAPEQIQKHPIRASDQYALGITVYEWLCGRPPFEGDLYNLYHQHLYVLPQPLRERTPEIPPAAETVVMKALAKKPEDRFGSITEFAINLQACLKVPVPVPGIDPEEGISTAPGLYRPFDIPASKPLVTLKDHTDWGAPVVPSTPTGPFSSSTMSSYDPQQLEAVSEHSRLEQRPREVGEKIIRAAWRLTQIVMFFAIGITAICETAFAHIAVEAGLPWSRYWWSGWSWWWIGGSGGSQDVMFAASAEGMIFTIVYCICLWSIYNDSRSEKEGLECLMAFLGASAAVEIIDAILMFLSPLTTNLDWEMLGVAFLATVVMFVIGLVVSINTAFMRSQ